MWASLIMGCYSLFSTVGGLFSEKQAENQGRIECMRFQTHHISQNPVLPFHTFFECIADRISFVSRVGRRECLPERSSVLCSSLLPCQFQRSLINLLFHIISEAHKSDEFNKLMHWSSLLMVKHAVTMTLYTASSSSAIGVLLLAPLSIVFLSFHLPSASFQHKLCHWAHVYAIIYQGQTPHIRLQRTAMRNFHTTMIKLAVGQTSSLYSKCHYARLGHAEGVPAKQVSGPSWLNLDV